MPPNFASDIDEYEALTRKHLKPLEEEKDTLNSGLEKKRIPLAADLEAATKPYIPSREDAFGTTIASVLPLVLGAALAGKKGAGFGGKAGGEAGTAFNKIRADQAEQEREGAEYRHRVGLADTEKDENRIQTLNDNLLSKSMGLEEDIFKAKTQERQFQQQEARLAEDARLRREKDHLRPDVSKKLEEQYFGKDLEGDLTRDEANQLREGAQEGRLREKETRAKDEFKLKLNSLNVGGWTKLGPEADNPKNVTKATEYSEVYGATFSALDDLTTAMRAGRSATGPELEQQMVAASNLAALIKTLPGRNAGAALTPLEAAVYFKVIPAFLQNPTKGLSAIAVEAGLGEDPVRQLTIYKKSLEKELTGRMKSRGFGRADSSDKELTLEQFGGDKAKLLAALKQQNDALEASQGVR